MVADQFWSAGWAGRFVGPSVEDESFGVERIAPVTVLNTEIEICADGIPGGKKRPRKWENPGHRIGRLRPLDAVPLEHVVTSRPIKCVTKLRVVEIDYPP